MSDVSPPAHATTAAPGAAAWVVVIVAALAVFALQAAYLHLASAANSDEGVNAEVARRIAAGARQYVDVPAFHMPLLQWLLALGFAAGADMYVLRLVVLAINCLAVVPLYGLLTALRPSRAAALTAVGFYLTYPAMVHHDFRFVTIRPLANVLLLVFLWLGVRARSGWRAFLAEAGTSVLSVLLFLPTALNLAAAATAAVLRIAAGARRRALLYRYAALAGLAALAVALVFLTMPESFAHVVGAQIGRPSIGWGERLVTIASARDDVFFYAVGIVGLLAGTASSRWRTDAFAMLAMVAVAVFGSANFYPHYLVVAAPAFCFGVYLIGALVETRGSRHARALATTVCLVLLAVHLARVGGALRTEWLGNRDPGYRALVARLAALPDPLLTLQPIYAVESGRRMLTELDLLALRAPDFSIPLTTDEITALGDRAGAILVERRAQVQIPTAVTTWLRRYRVDTMTAAGIILVP